MEQAFPRQAADGIGSAAVDSRISEFGQERSTEGTPGLFDADLFN
jgi:hypothetical protein